MTNHIDTLVSREEENVIAAGHVTTHDKLNVPLVVSLC